MLIWQDLIVMFIGIFLLVKGSDYLVNGASNISKKFNISPMVIGMTVVAFGTSLPEFVVSLLSAIEKNNQLGLGNIIGSNIANIALVLGISAIYKPIEIKRETLIKDLPIVFIISIISYILMFDKIVSFSDGLILTFLFILFMSYIYFEAKIGHGELAEELGELEQIQENTGVFKNLALVMIGIVGLIGGAKLTIYGGVNIATLIGISPLVIGLTFVAVGTSLPELATTLQSLRKNEHEIGVGNIIGSNAFNLLFVMGTVSLVNSYHVDNWSLKVYGPLMIVLLPILFILSFGKLKINRLSGFILLIIYASYTYLTYNLN